MARAAHYPVSSFRLPAVLELAKPATWLPPMWAFVCGLHSTAGTPDVRWSAVIGGLLLTGPLVCATSQAVNDWFDRHVDAINAPDRPIPSGRLPGRTGLYVAIAWTIVSLLVAGALGYWVALAGTAAIGLAWAYSAPPLRLKRNGWWGNAVVAFCYAALPWLTGAGLVGGGPPSVHVAVIALLYAVGVHGIITLNAIKSVDGDRQMGIRSVPVQQGEFNALALACFLMAVSQAVIAALLGLWGHPAFALIICVLWLAQLCLMDTLLDQRARDVVPWYSGVGVGLFLLGMLFSAFALHGSA